MLRREFLKSIAAAAAVTASLRLSSIIDTSFLSGALPCYLSYVDVDGERKVLPMVMDSHESEAVYTIDGEELYEPRLAVPLEHADFVYEGNVWNFAEHGQVDTVEIFGGGATLTVQLPEWNWVYA
jgi:hypothetical protein